MMKRRGKVEWKAEEAAHVKAQPMFPHQHDSTPPEVLEKVLPLLVVGSMWVTRVPQQSLTQQYASYFVRYKRHEHDYLVNTFTVAPNVVQAMTQAIYAGLVRVEEDKGKGHVVRVARHTFIIGSTRYMVLNLADFIPIEMDT